MLLLISLADNRVNFLLYMLTAAAGPYIFCMLLRRQSGINSDSALLFGLGSYISMGIFAMFTFNPVIIITNIIVIVFVLRFAHKIIRENKPELLPLQVGSPIS
jgi:fumarate reductase subunit C